MELSAQVLCGLEALGALQEETFQTILERSLQAAIQPEGEGEVVSIATDPSNCLHAQTCLDRAMVCARRLPLLSPHYSWSQLVLMQTPLHSGNLLATTTTD